MKTSSAAPRVPLASCDGFRDVSCTFFDDPYTYGEMTSQNYGHDTFAILWVELMGEDLGLPCYSNKI